MRRPCALTGRSQMRDSCYGKSLTNCLNRLRMDPNMHAELENAKSHIVVELIEYMPNAIVSKTIIKKTTGNIIATSFDMGEELSEKIIPFDTYIQIIDGAAEIMIDDELIMLKLGEGMIIPAHVKQRISANEKFKMIATVIKSGYD